MRAAEEAASNQPGAASLRVLALASARGKAALPLIREAEAEVADTMNSQKALTLIAAYVVAGDHERAWKLLERAEQLGLARTQFILREPLLEPLRKDPRYPAFLSKLKIHPPPGRPPARDPK